MMNFRNKYILGVTLALSVFAIFACSTETEVEVIKEVEVPVIVEVEVIKEIEGPQVVVEKIVEVEVVVTATPGP